MEGADGRWMGGVDGRWMGGRPHPGSPQACQARSSMLSIPHHPKVHDPSHKLLRIEERLAYLFYYDGFNGMDLVLIIL